MYYRLSVAIRRSHLQGIISILLKIRKHKNPKSAILIAIKNATKKI